MELNVKEYGPIIVHRIFKKSDEGTQLEFEKTQVDKSICPQLDTLIQFLDFSASLFYG
jgi:hypothetical protein